jgi:hypothetical protein
MKIFHNALYAVLAIALIGLFHQKSIAQNTSLQGRVTDRASGELLVGAVVALDSTSLATVTDALGVFKLSGVKPGNFTLRVTYLGYEPLVMPLRIPASGMEELVLAMNPGTLNLSEVTVLREKEIGKTINQISKIDVLLRPVQSSQDVLRIIPGLFTAQHAGGGKAEQIYLRGFDIDHGTDIRVTVDGMPVNMVSHAHGQGYADLHFLIPEVIDYVDFDKGPYYAAQGDLNTAGFADFKTKNALGQSRLKLEAGRFDTFRALGLFDLLDKKQGQNAYIATEYLFTDGPFDSPQNFNRINLFGKYNGLIGENKILTASLSQLSSRWEASGQIPDRAVRSGLIDRFGAIDDNEGGSTSRSNATVKLVQQMHNGDLFSNQAYFVRNNFQLYSNFTFFLEDSIHGDQIRQTEKRDIYGFNSAYTMHRPLGGVETTTELGWNLRYDKTYGTELAHTYQRRTVLDSLAFGDINQINASMYVDETLHFGDRFVLNAGLRFDQFSFGYVNRLDSLYDNKVVTAHILSPKLSLFYNLSPQVQVYLKSGLGFHSNDTRVVVPQDGKEVLPRAYGSDIGFFLKPTKSIFLNLAGWILDLDQEFVYVGDAAVVEPSGKTRRFGLDFSARVQLTDWLFFDGDLNLTKPRSKDEPEGQNYVPLAPTFTTIGGLTTRFAKGFNASLRYRHVGDRPANEDNSVTALGYTVLDGGITYRMPKFEIGFTAENLLNVEWNEAQFDTESRLKGEAEPVSELHYTPGTPFFIKGSVSFFF